MTTRWVDVFLDRPRADVDVAASFWAQVVGGALSPWRERHTFTTLLPSTGDAYVRVQAVEHAGPRDTGHLDLRADDPAGESSRLQALGATLVRTEPGLVVLRSPAGLPLCLTPYDEPRPGWRPPAVGDPPCRLDQVTLDLPGAAFEAESGFWAAATGWDLLAASAAEFRVLRAPGWGSESSAGDDERQPGPPVRLLLQRLGEVHGPAGMHVDLACADRAVTAVEHVGLGAMVVGYGRRWTVMHDPTGAPYCLTDRDPRTGTLPA